MSDPSTTQQAPFNPHAVQVPRDGPGCSKPAVVGCLVVLLVVSLGVVASMAPTFIRWSFRKIEESIAPRLPADLTAAERTRLHTAFATAAQAASTGQGDFDTMRRFQTRMLALENTTGMLSHRDVADLTAMLEALGRGRAAPGAPGPGAPAPGTGPPAKAPPPPNGMQTVELPRPARAA